MGNDNLDGTFYYDYREKMATLKDREDNLK